MNCTLGGETDTIKKMKIAFYGHVTHVNTESQPPRSSLSAFYFYRNLWFTEMEIETYRKWESHVKMSGNVTFVRSSLEYNRFSRKRPSTTWVGKESAPTYMGVLDKQ